MPSKLSDIDPNFKIASFDGYDSEWFDVHCEPFKIDGIAVHDRNKPFCRIPENILKDFSEGINFLAHNTSGARLRFRTDSKHIALSADICYTEDFPHMPRTASSGFDLYVRFSPDEHYSFIKPFMPQTSKDMTINGIADVKSDGKLYEVTINFPLYAGVSRINIGLEKGSVIKPPLPYKIEKPFLFYGSSITQGACASRPGNAYTTILSRWFDADYLNFGFSGNAKGEENMAAFLSEFDPSIFFLDYDHNAPDTEHLKATHEKFFNIIRKAHPQLPIIIITKPDFDSDKSANDERRRIIFKTYENAVSSGDKNVYFIDGELLFGQSDRDGCTVDICHPNDLGFMRMAECISKTVKDIIEK